MSSSNISSHSLYPPNLSDDKIRSISWAFVNDFYLDLDLDKRASFGIKADVVFENEFYNKRKSKNTIIKMSKTKYIDDFFNFGKLQIGTFKYFRKFDDPEIGDKYEGSCLLVGRNKQGTSFTKITSGFDRYIFCAYDGKPDTKTIEKFGYDDYFEIVDMTGFLNAISQVLKSKNSYSSRCIYKKDRVLVSNPLASYNINILSSEIRKVANEMQYYLKSKEFEHQNEYRFTWEVDNDVEEPLIVTCKDAIKFCKRR